MAQLCQQVTPSQLVKRCYLSWRARGLETSQFTHCESDTESGEAHLERDGAEKIACESLKCYCPTIAATIPWRLSRIPIRDCSTSLPGSVVES